MDTKLVACYLMLLCKGTQHKPVRYYSVFIGKGTQTSEMLLNFNGKWTQTSEMLFSIHGQGGGGRNQ